MHETCKRTSGNINFEFGLVCTAIHTGDLCAHGKVQKKLAPKISQIDGGRQAEVRVAVNCADVNYGRFRLR